jgi:multicomponent Na+:H+ antiporter subunit D
MLPVLPVIVPLFTAALLAALTKAIPRPLANLLAIASVVTNAVLSGILLRDSLAQPIVYWFGNWFPRHGLALGISFVVDPLGAGLATFVCVLALASLVFSSQYFDTAANHYHALVLVFVAALCGFCLTGDTFNLFVFFELMSAAAFALCGYKTEDPGSLQGSLNFAVTNTIGAYFVLSGVGVLYARTGALNMAQIGRALAAGGPVDKLVAIAFAFVIFGYLIKAAVVPFHFWLADAHAVAPTPVCLLFSGVMVEMGLYALARLYWAVFDPALHRHLTGLRTLFVTMGVATALAAAFMCYLQRNLKRLLAFSTISHVGLMTVGIGVFSPLGLAGSAVYTLGHGLVKSALFLATGILLHRFGSVDEFELRGRGRSERWTAVVFLLGGIGLCGFPFSGISSGDDLIQAAAVATGFPWMRWIILFASAVTAAAVFRAGGHVFLGWGAKEDETASVAPQSNEKRETEKGHQETPATMFIPALVLVTAGLLLGLSPQLASETSAAAARFEDAGAYAAHVLEGRPAAPLGSTHSVQPEPRMGFFALLGALAIALLHLFSPQARQLARFAAKPIQLLHRVHSGHIGDYVAFLTLGMAVYALVCAFCFTGR